MSVASVVDAPAGLAGVEERAEMVVGEPGQARELERVEIDDTPVLLVLDPQPRPVRAPVDLDADGRELARELEPRLRGPPRLGAVRAAHGFVLRVAHSAPRGRA